MSVKSPQFNIYSIQEMVPLIHHEYIRSNINSYIDRAPRIIGQSRFTNVIH